MQKDIADDLQEGFSKVIEKYLEKYFSIFNEDVPGGFHGRILNEVERNVLNVTLKHTNMNQIKAAKILGINRNTLRKKMSLYEIGEDK